MLEGRALQILRKQFAEWAHKKRWYAANLVDLSDAEYDEDVWYSGGGSISTYLRRITEDPDMLASEVHQIGFDGGIRKMTTFLQEYRRQLRRSGLSEEEQEAALMAVESATEHSH